MYSKAAFGMIVAIIALGGCKSADVQTASSQSPSPAPALAVEKTKAKSESAKKSEKSSACQIAVTDSTKAVEGEGCKIKGIDNWEGEISGVPAKASKFTKLKIGMSTNQVIALIGSPTDSGAHLTGKAFIPFYYGSDKSRIEYVYKNQGRLLFATSQWGASPGLIWIIHNSNERGNR